MLPRERKVEVDRVDDRAQDGREGTGERWRSIGKCGTWKGRVHAGIVGVVERLTQARLVCHAANSLQASRGTSELSHLEESRSSFALCEVRLALVPVELQLKLWNKQNLALV